jgi:hypothetical protein
MRLGIMQPYFFPYVGYFELIYRTDLDEDVLGTCIETRVLLHLHPPRTYVNENVASLTVHVTAERDGARMKREPGAVQPVLPWQTVKYSDDFGPVTCENVELGKNQKG